MLDINLQYLNLNFKYFSNNCENSKKSCVQYLFTHEGSRYLVTLLIHKKNQASQPWHCIALYFKGLSASDDWWLFKELSLAPYCP